MNLAVWEGEGKLRLYSYNYEDTFKERVGRFIHTGIAQLWDGGELFDLEVIISGKVSGGAHTNTHSHVHTHARMHVHAHAHTHYSTTTTTTCTTIIIIIIVKILIIVTTLTGACISFFK